MKKSEPTFHELTVILGDPRLPDLTKVGHRFSPEDLESVELLKEALEQIPGYRFSYLNDHTGLLDELRLRPPAFVVAFCDTGFKNVAVKELELAAFLDLLEIPYSGSGPVCLGLCYDKSLVNAIAGSMGIAVPEETYCDIGDSQPEVGHTFPALIKPVIGDGSVGITSYSVVQNREEARECVQRLRTEWPGRDVLVQEFLSGDEYGIGLIGNPDQGLTALPALEVDYSGLDAGLPRILSYESKTVPESPYWKQIRYRQAQISPESLEYMLESSRRLFRRLGCRDYARFDFRRDEVGAIKLMEVNPNPAWCWDGKLNLMAGFAGWSYSDLLRMILEASQRRVRD